MKGSKNQGAGAVIETPMTSRLEGGTVWKGGVPFPAD